MTPGRVLSFLAHAGLCAFFLTFAVFAVRVALADVRAGLPLLALLWALLCGLGCLAAVEAGRRTALAWKPGEGRSSGPGPKP